MFDKARAHRLKNPPKAKSEREELPLLDTKIAKDFLHSVSKKWPEVQKQIGPFIAKSREKLGDVYSSVAQVLAAQKEAFEDHVAEKRNRSKPAPAQKHRGSTTHSKEDGEP